MKRSSGSVVSGVVAGALAGLLASYAMNEFQEALSRLAPSEGGESDDPATVKAAERLAGHELPKAEKEEAGNKVHYGFGCLLGALYGGLAEVLPMVRVGFGTGYGAAVALIADEVAVPALRLAPPAWKSPASTHANSLGSHLVFGAALEGARWLLRRPAG